MGTTSIAFLAFATLCALLCGLWRNAAWQRAVMLVANLLFLASFSTSAQAWLPYLAFLAAGYAAMLLVRRVRSGVALGCAVAALLLAFCWLKQYWFLSFVPGLGIGYATIGMSYVFFRVLALVIDSREAEEIGPVGPLDYLNFALNFPTLVAGPIDRYQQFSAPYERPSPAVIGAAIERIIVGLFKVLACSAVVGAWQGGGTAQLLAGSPQPVWQGVLSLGLYPIYLYFNFSGYSDIVIGFGRLLGKTYPENFNAPFVATSFLEFWTRWHMSLSNWLRDYLYTPLLMALMQRVRRKGADAYLGVLAYFVTFFVIGIWHGSTLIFAIYGLLLGLGVSVNKLWQLQMAQRLGKKRYKQLGATHGYRLFARAATYTWYCLCMLCFWATGAQALDVLASLGAAGALGATLGIFALASLASAAYEFRPLEGGAWAAGRGRFAGGGQLLPYLRAGLAGLLTVGCIAALMLSQGKAPAIIYQAF